MPGRPRKQLPMSDEEIRREYRLAKNPAKQIRILADENSCDVKTIRRIVAEEGKTDLSTGFAGPPPLAGEAFPEENAEGMAAEARNAEKEKKMEKEMELPSETPTWHPLPSAPPQAAADFPEGTDDLGPSSLPDVQDLPEAGRVTGLMKLRAAERRYFLTEHQFMELWFILGKLQGVLDAASEAGKPGEVMKDAVDELESLLRSVCE